MECMDVYLPKSKSVQNVQLYKELNPYKKNIYPSL